MNPFDLQIQTTASDGRHSPLQCVAMAKANGVAVVAITDHDTIGGITEAVAAGKKLGIRVIPGIEISVQEHGMHLLGLGIDIENALLRETLAKAAENRRTAAQHMVKNFQDGGFVVEWEDVLSEAGQSTVITRPHIVSAIMKRPENKEKLEGITTKHEFFQRYFTDAGSYYVRASEITPTQAIALVHGAGGVAVWAHPTIPDFVGNCPELEKFLQTLVSYGLDGLELFGPFLTESDVGCLERMVERYHLIKTAGSDFHEVHPEIVAGAPWPHSSRTVGDFPTYGRSLEGILSSLEEAMARQRRVAAGA